jgi:hypothetical protein
LRNDNRSSRSATKKLRGTPAQLSPGVDFETFYAWNVNEWTTVTFDYQFIANPAYNADRGPVSLFARAPAPSFD